MERQQIVRALAPGYEIREDGDGPPVMHGQFSRLDEWTEIRSVVEARQFGLHEPSFIERSAPGAFEKTIQEQRDTVKVVYHHGLDPWIGTRVLGTITRLDPDTSYEVELFDADYNHSLLPGLRAGVYGSSFRGDVIKHSVDPKPRPSEHNPKGLPEVTYTELRLKDFGPTPFPAYKGATALMRSLTDQYTIDRIASDPEVLRAIQRSGAAALLDEKPEPEATTSSDLEPPHSQAHPDERKEEWWVLQS